ncbi:MAG: DUF367 family protein [Candidatus Hodarchaeota archaeon]
MEFENFNEDFTLGLKLHVLHLDQCDPRKCTSKKLKKFNLVKFHKTFRTIPIKSIKLNPFAEKELSIEDKELVTRHGITVIDCSWKKAREIFETKKLVNDRKIPITFLAGNSINYTMPGKLSSVEAFAACLIITGYPNEARFLLSKFKWGHTFWELNQEKIETIINSGFNEE